MVFWRLADHLDCAFPKSSSNPAFAIFKISSTSHQKRKLNCTILVLKFQIDALEWPESAFVRKMRCLVAEGDSGRITCTAFIDMDIYRRAATWLELDPFRSLRLTF
jgi:hypothetical protein